MRIFSQMGRWLLRLAPVLFFVAGVGWLWANRVDVQAIPQKVIYHDATVSDKAAMRVCPEQHKVIIEPVDENRLVGVLASALPPPLGRGGQNEMQGFYDPNDGHIQITGGLPRLSAAMPVAALRGLYYRALRHEYGHAFLHDWMKEKRAGDRAWDATLQDAEHIDPKSMPRALRESVTEYRAMDSASYGVPYFTSSYGEFMAESYARVLSGWEVPPKTEKFLRAAGSR
jgi:hypothetical protein